MLNPLMLNQLVNNPSGLPQVIPPAATSIVPATTLPTTMPHTVAPPQIASKFPALPFPVSASASTVPSPQASLLSNPVVQAALSRALNPNAAVAPGPKPPPTMSELTRKYGLWKGFAEKIQQDPAFMQGLLTFGATMMSPHAPGTPAFANLGPAIMGAEKAYNSTNAIIAKSLQARQALGLAAANTQVKGAGAAGAIIKDAGGAPSVYKDIVLQGLGPNGQPTSYVKQYISSGRGAGNGLRSVANVPGKFISLSSSQDKQANALVNSGGAIRLLATLSKIKGAAGRGVVGTANHWLLKYGFQALGPNPTAATAYDAILKHMLAYIPGLLSGVRMSVPILKIINEILPLQTESATQRLAKLNFTKRLIYTSAATMVSEVQGTGKHLPTQIYALANLAKKYNVKGGMPALRAAFPTQFKNFQPVSVHTITGQKPVTQSQKSMILTLNKADLQKFLTLSKTDGVTPAMKSYAARRLKQLELQ